MSFDHVIFPSIMEDRMWGFYVLLSQDAEQISKPYQVLLSIRNIVLFGVEDFKFQMKIRDRVSFMGFDVKHTVGIDFCHLLIFDILCNFRIK